jgi:hypothetical protein
VLKAVPHSAFDVNVSTILHDNTITLGTDCTVALWGESIFTHTKVGFTHAWLPRSMSGEGSSAYNGVILKGPFPVSGALSSMSASKMVPPAVPLERTMIDRLRSTSVIIQSSSVGVVVQVLLENLSVIPVLRVGGRTSGLRFL